MGILDTILAQEAEKQTDAIVYKQGYKDGFDDGQADGFQKGYASAKKKYKDREFYDEIPNT